jgi:GTP-binding protein
MLPVVALIGRPNVGKSTLFNAMTGTRDALVADLPGLTRDRQYGFARRTEVPCIVVDTGGLVENPEMIESLMVQQTERAIAEADRLIILVDGRAGVTPQDQFVAQLARRSGKPLWLAVNKTEGFDPDVAVSDFHGLGLGEPIPVAAAHDQGVIYLLETVLEGMKPDPSDGPEMTGIKVAVIGRPNVGKSTLINRLLGENRMVAFDQPGTTRDAVLVPFERDGERYTLIDTAGVRRKSKVEEAVEKFSVIKTLQAIESAHVVVVVMDAHDTVAEQDASLLGTVIEQGRALVLAVNKWDNIPTEQRDLIRQQVEQRLEFASFAPLHFISARHGSGVGELFQTVRQVYAAATRDMATPELTRVLEAAVESHPPKVIAGRRIKLRYAHQGGQNPPIIVVHGNQTDHIPEAYRRYLVNVFRKAFDLQGTPVRVIFKGEDNPYAGKRNPLTPRQVRKRKRLIQRNKRD